VSVISPPVVAVIPGTGADEDAADEVVRPVVSIRSTSVRIIAVITIRADWRAGYVAVTVAIVIVVVVIVAVVIAVVVTVVVVIGVAGIAIPDPNSHRNLRMCRRHPCDAERQSEHSHVF